jgi:hypothetical protein
MRGWMTWWYREGHWKGRRRITSGKKEQHVWYSPPMTGAHINGNETPQWSKTIRNVTRRGSTESLMEDRLHLGTNKWRQGLFDNRPEVGGEDQKEPEQICQTLSPEKWEKISSGQWIQRARWKRMVTQTVTWEQSHTTPVFGYACDQAWQMGVNLSGASNVWALLAECTYVYSRYVWL